MREARGHDGPVKNLRSKTVENSSQTASRVRNEDIVLTSATQSV